VAQSRALKTAISSPAPQKAAPAPQAPPPSRGAPPRLMPAGKPKTMAPANPAVTKPAPGALSGRKPQPAKARLRPGAVKPPMPSRKAQGPSPNVGVMARDRSALASQKSKIGSQLGDPAASYGGGALGQPASTADDQDPTV
jgi:hypothetical protein